MINGLVNSITGIYDKHNGDPNPKNAVDESLAFLKDVNTITALSHYLSEKEGKFNGDLITNVKNKSLFKVLKQFAKYFLRSSLFLKRKYEKFKAPMMSAFGIFLSNNALTLSRLTPLSIILATVCMSPPPNLFIAANNSCFE